MSAPKEVALNEGELAPVAETVVAQVCVLLFLLYSSHFSFQNTHNTSRHMA